MARKNVRREQQSRASESDARQGTSDDRAVGLMEDEGTRGPAPEPDAIARRAYELYCERGCEPGREMDDWLRAEQELRGARSEHRGERLRARG